jgi:hypothetical protein
MRVEVKIPGGVKMHAIDERGTKYISTSIILIGQPRSYGRIMAGNVSFKYDSFNSLRR